METYLVTGGAGFVGSTVARELLRAGHRVVVFDDLSKGHRTALPAGITLVEGDLADRAAIDRVLAAHPVDAVLHFAAFIEAGESMREPERFFRNNTANTLNLLEAMLGRGIRRFVFSSTAALYGDPERTPIEETDRLAPTNAYGESKLLVERVLDWYYRLHGLRSASLRYFNAAGAPDGHGEDHAPETHLIPLVLQVALGTRASVSIFGTDYPTPDGTCVRDYVHVLDLASAHLLALGALRDAERDDPERQRGRLIYNLGNGQGFSVRQVIDVARRITGHAIPVVEAPRRAGDPATLVASSDKIRRELGWTPRFPGLDEIVSSAWRWHQAQPRGYDGH